MPFTNVATINAIVAQSLTYRLHIIPHGNAVCYHAVGMWKRTSEDCTSGWPTDWLAGICILITDSFLSQAIQIWCLYPWIAIASDHIFSGCIRHQEYQLFLHIISSFSLRCYGLFCSSLDFNILLIYLHFHV